MSDSAIAVNEPNENVVLDRLPQAAIIAAIVAFAGNFIILQMGRAFGTPFEVMMPGTIELQPLPIWPTLILVCIGAAIAGAVALMLLANNESVANPITAFGLIGVVVFAVSLYGPSEAVADSALTVTGLQIMHGWTALAVVGVLSTVARQTLSENDEA